MAEHILKIDINKIFESPYQGRLLMFGKTNEENAQTAIRNLAENIQANGLLNPIVVRAKENGYELIDGHRRLEATRLLGKTQIDAIIKDIDEKNAQVMGIVSNLQREDLYNIERALAFKKILDAGIFKDQKELSQAIGKDQTYVGDLLGTLKLDKRIIDDLLKNKKINDVRMMRSIRRVGEADENGYNEEQWKLYQKVIEQGLTRKEVLQIANQDQSNQVKETIVKFKPRRIEVELPKKYTLKQRKQMTEKIKHRIDEILKEFEEKAE